jgi:hypothetical protein
MNPEETVQAALDLQAKKLTGSLREISPSLYIPGMNRYSGL